MQHGSGRYKYKCQYLYFEAIAKKKFMTSALCASVSGDVRSTSPVCVLIHGFLGDRRDMDALRCAIGSQCHLACVSLDMPGHGDTARLGNVSSAVKAVEDAIDALLGSSCPLVLIGYSMGGRIALQLASRQPQRVQAIAVLSSNPGIESADQREERVARDAKLAARLHTMQPPAFVAWLRDEWYCAPLWGALRSHAGFEAMVRRRADGAHPADRADSLALESVGRQAPLWEWLQTAPMPILFAAGQLDSAYAPMVQRVLARSNATCAAGSQSAALIEGAAHALLLEAPNEIARRCTTFFRTLSCCRGAQPAGGVGAGGGGVQVTSRPRLVPFELPLTAPLPLARGDPLTARTGCLVLVSGSVSSDGGSNPCCGVGEICPLPNFHSETYAEAYAQLEQACASIEGVIVPWSVATLDGTMNRWLTTVVAVELLPSVRCALECALFHLLGRHTTGGMRALLARSGGLATQTHVRMNGLMARGETVCVEAAADAEEADARSVEWSPGASGDGHARLGGMRTWKLKVGGADPEAEGVRVSRLLAGCAALGVRLRLDANQAWSEESASTFCVALRACTGDADADGDIVPQAKRSRSSDGVRGSGMWPPPALEFCEEPLSQACTPAAAEAFYATHGLHYALDESAVPVAAEIISSWQDGADDGPCVMEMRSRLAGAGCAALVLKPTLLGGLEVSAALANEAAKHSVPVVFTSAFESGVSHAHIALTAAVLGGPSVAHGLSTFERLATDVLNPPFASTVSGGDLIDAAAAQDALDATADAL